MRRVELGRPVSLDHLARMTDCFGLIQHANYTLPEFRTGYTTDDNARALMVAAEHYRNYRQRPSLVLAERYLSFLMYAQTPDGRFHNFISYSRTPLDSVGSEDAFGRALWALAYVLARPPRAGLVGPAERMLHESLAWVDKLEHPRSKAYCLVALYWWAQSERGDVARARLLAEPLADYLMSSYEESRQQEWDWITPEFTYANAILPKALFRAYQLLGEERYLQVAEQTMAFLANVTRVGDTLRVVGNREWIEPDDTPVPALYDQQPIEAGTMVLSSIVGHDVTGKTCYLRWAMRSLEWFYGRNVKGLSLYDPETAGCFDALMEGGVNQNRGAESTLSLLLARLAMLDASRRLSDRAIGEAMAEDLMPR